MFSSLLWIMTSLLPSSMLMMPLADPPVAATVNGETIPETSVQRALRNVPPEQHTKARKELIQYLVDNLLIEQHLRNTVKLDEKELENRMNLIKEQAKKNNIALETMLAQLQITEAELRRQVAADLRWETYCASQFTDDKLRDFFNASKESFDGSTVSARHILVATGENATPADKEKARAKLVAIRNSLEQELQKKLTGVPSTDSVAYASQRLKVITELFAAAATKDSDCPSKKNGGDLGSFPRLGHMVEPFAKAAFLMQPGQMTDVVETQFGYHVILVTGRIPGRDVEFDQVKDSVKEVVGDRLREQMLPGLRAKATIKVNEVK